MAMREAERFENHLAASASPKWSIVVPCFRSGPWLPELVERIATSLSECLSDLELILVDDASPDRETWPAIEDLARHHPFVRGIGLQFNVGQYRALIAGLEASRGEWVITMDDDLQTPPEELPKLVAAALGNADEDAIIGRYDEKHHSVLRNLGSKGVAWIQKTVYGAPPGLETTSFRILRRALVDAICAERGADPSFPAILLRNTRRVRNIDVDHQPRAHGESGYSLFHLVSIVLAQYFDASTLPLRLVSVVGSLVSMGAILFGAYSFVGWWSGRIIEPGFTTLVLLISFLGGLILLALGIVGEYLIRLVVETRGAPRYVVRERIDGPRAGDDR